MLWRQNVKVSSRYPGKPLRALRKADSGVTIKYKVMKARRPTLSLNFRKQLSNGRVPGKKGLAEPDLTYYILQ